MVSLSRWQRKYRCPEHPCHPSPQISRKSSGFWYPCIQFPPLPVRFHWKDSSKPASIPYKSDRPSPWRQKFQSDVLQNPWSVWYTDDRNRRQHPVIKIPFSDGPPVPAHSHSTACGNRIIPSPCGYVPASELQFQSASHAYPSPAHTAPCNRPYSGYGRWHPSKSYSGHVPDGYPRSHTVARHAKQTLHSPHGSPAFFHRFRFPSSASESLAPLSVIFHAFQTLSSALTVYPCIPYHFLLLWKKDAFYLRTSCNAVPP